MSPVRRPLSWLVTAILVALVAFGPSTFVTAQGSDDNIPNAVIYGWGTSQPGGLDYTVGDTDDVYRVDLKKGDYMVIGLSGSKGSDFDLYLFGPDAVNIQEDVEIASSETSGTSSESIRYTAAKDGSHYLDIADWDTTGTYTLTMRVRPTITLAAQPPTYDYTTNYGSASHASKVIVSGAIWPIRPGINLRIEELAPGGHKWERLGTTAIGTDGKYSFRYIPLISATIRAAWGGDAAFLSTTGQTAKIKVRPRFTHMALSDSTIATGAVTKISGRVQLDESNYVGNEPVTLEWKKNTQTTYSTRSTTTTNKSGYFQFTFSSDTTGTFNFRPRYKGSDQWLEKTGPAATVVVE